VPAIDRLESSALYFGFRFHRSRIASTLGDLLKSPAFAGGIPQRVRLTLAASGKLSTEVSPYSIEPSEIRIWLTAERVSPNDLFRRRKTTRREAYDRLYEKARDHCFEDVIFTNEKGEVTEGAISNIFIERDRKMLTPPLSSGALPGVLRRHVLKTREGSEEAVLTVDDLQSADGIFLCSSLRGLRRVASLSTTLGS
jgi:para-aminobenzoate synthetase/4-amino-4-deoxychorismate lyase